MLVGLSGYLAGYNGSFEFKSGEKYPEDVNYTFMRAFNAMFGVVCVPLAYYTARDLNFRRATVWLISFMVLFENSYATISRFILLDSMLLCFTFTTTMCWARFHRLQHASFSPEWYAWLCLTGLSIGCVCSVKWVGFFCTAIVGLYTIEDLWNKFGDLKMPQVSIHIITIRSKALTGGHLDGAGEASPCSCRGFDCHPACRIHVLFLCAFPRSCEQRPRRCSDELPFPGQFAWY